MNPLIQLKKATSVFFVALACFALFPRAQAVVPAPDGAYGPPAYGTGNTAEGQTALLSLTSGAFNTADGFFSLRAVTQGSFNTATGAGALLANIANENTAVGAGALLSNSMGTLNTANGAFALFHNTTGSRNNAVGSNALISHTTGDFNNAVGAFALSSSTGGSSNNAFGDAALGANTTGFSNTAIGDTALGANTTGNYNTANGYATLLASSTGSNNIALGAFSGQNVTTASDVICIGNDGQNTSNSCFIGQIFGVTSSGGTPVFINSAGQLGTGTSSRRFKEEIKPMGETSEALFALKPVTFRYKRGIDPQSIPQFGLVAEDVEVVNPALVVRDKEGKPYSVRYDQVNAMLLNEFLKEHHQMQDLKAVVAQQQKQIEVLIAGLQKVSAELEMSKATSSVVLNNP